MVEPCCWKTYNKHRATADTLATLDRLNIDVARTSGEDLAIKFGIDRHNRAHDERFSAFKRLKPLIWQLFEEPRSSKAASVSYFFVCFKPINSHDSKLVSF